MRLHLLAYLVLAVLPLGCGANREAATGTIRFTIDGTVHEITGPSTEEDDSSPEVMFWKSDEGTYQVQGRDSNGVEFYLTLPSIEPGSYSTDASTKLYVSNFPADTDLWMTQNSGGVATIEITESSDTQVKGTFSGTNLSPVPLFAPTKDITEGSFDVYLRGHEVEID